MSGTEVINLVGAEPGIGVTVGTRAPDIKDQKYAHPRQVQIASLQDCPRV